MNEPDLSGKALLKKYATRCNTHISSLATAGLKKNPRLVELIEPVLYVTQAGGKRIRPALVYASAEALGIEPNDAKQKALDYIACAVELIHTYSLIHDDLPAMDDDSLRRGKPTLHKIYSDSTAILIGDGLQTQAFELIVNSPNLSPDQRIRIIDFVGKAAGLEGMVGGQFIDIASTGSEMSLEKLKSMHALKTGALLQVSAVIGGIVASASEPELTCLQQFGSHIGLAFQVTDDILDAVGTSETLGKTPGKDAKKNKSTYVTFLGIKEAKRIALKSLERALTALAPLGSTANSLREIARIIVERNN